MPIRGVFFDLYGTLLQYGDMQAAWSAWLTAFYDCLCRYGLTVSPAAFAAQCDRFLGQAEPPARADGFTVFERRIHTLCGVLGLHVPAEHISHIATTVTGVWQRHMVLDPDSRPVLQTLKQRYTLALISNFDHPPHVYQVLAASELVDYFQTILISGEVGVKKPAPQIFQYALERTGLQPAEVVHVGDTDDDVLGAWAAAIRPITIRRAGHPPQALDVHVAQATSSAGSHRPCHAAVSTITRLSDVLTILGHTAQGGV
jgi:putative hydrolase of the HAD superfamily